MTMTCREALLLLLNQMDYTVHACSPTDMIAACVPAEVIDLCREAIDAAMSAQSDKEESK